MSFDSLIRQAQSFVEKELGLGGDAQSDFGGLQELPWSLDDPQEAFFKPQDIDTKRWNKLYPYRLLVIDITKPDRIYGGSGTGGNLRTKKSKVERPNGGIEYVLTQQVMNGSWELNLPITPQQLQITDQFSINTSATMRGIVEEHNGIKFKTITAGGTTGIWAARPTIGGIPKAPSSLGTIFAGTLGQFNNVLNDLKRVGRAFSGSHPSSVESAQTPGDHESTLFSTGYYQALYLGQFLERYAQLKKNPRNKNLRLVFDIPKQKQAFIVTPQVFSLEQNQQRPMEMMWKFQLKAWKRIKLDSPPPAVNELPKLDSNVFQRIVGTIREVRRTLGNSINLLKAVRSDFQRPLNVLRQTALAVKDVYGFTATAIDLPRQLILDAQSAIEDAGAAIDSGGQILGDTLTRNLIAAGIISEGQAGGGGGGGLTVSKLFGGGGGGRGPSAIREGLTKSAVEGGALGSDAAQKEATSPTNGLFSEPEAYFDVFESLEADSLELSREQQEARERDLEEVRLLTVDDFKGFKEEIQTLALDISNNFGAGDDTFADIFNRPDPKSRVTPMTLEENEVLAALFEAVQMYDLLTSTLSWDDNDIISPLQFVGGLANESEIEFNETESKLLVPVPFGLTIEEIAARYLEDPDKWVEIVTINKLSSPYIDEEGFSYNLLSNGFGRQFNVDDTEERIYVGQRIILKSDNQAAFARKVIDVEKIGDGNYLVTVDGLGDLEKLTTNANASIQGYLPGTVNSQNQIYIPVDAPADPDDRIDTPDFLDEDVLTRVSKIDWLLTDDGDIALNQLGELRLANGLTNLIQALKIKVRTKKGTLLRHLDFGLGIDYGISVADIEAGEVFSAMNKMIEDDSRFAGIDRLDIRLNGTTLSIDMAVRVAGGTGVVPITFNI